MFNLFRIGVKLETEDSYEEKDVCLYVERNDGIITVALMLMMMIMIVMMV